MDEATKQNTKILDLPSHVARQFSHTEPSSRERSSASSIEPSQGERRGESPTAGSPALVDVLATPPHFVFSCGVGRRPPRSGFSQKGDAGMMQEGCFSGRGSGPLARFCISGGYVASR
ncbi:hypothetical protein EYF80_055517 [Liparis tanakae]|uniref:Uncharacterized protein n=1 Tax=Liparis tanakae TaxID=230148 RepID=A0A4Z2F0P2_9TELE|nr:hypothetical protein EYF80_055517 [Liparis tanakae]